MAAVGSRSLRAQIFAIMQAGARRRHTQIGDLGTNDRRNGLSG
jgi:hypothetical protein